MERNQIFKAIYAGLAIFGTYLTATRLMAGDWVAALWPLAIVLFCVYRLFTMDRRDDQ
jgi:hypothetical protein